MIIIDDANLLNMYSYNHHSEFKLGTHGIRMESACNKTNIHLPCIRTTCYTYTTLDEPPQMTMRMKRFVGESKGRGISLEECH